MNIADITMQFVKYRITRFDIQIPGHEIIKVDTDKIGDFTIEKDYENFYFPYIEITVMLPKNIRELVLKNHDNVSVYMKLEYGHFDDLYDTDIEKVLYGYGSIFDQKFYALIEDESPQLTSGNQSDRRMEEIGTDMQAIELKPLQMALYNYDHFFGTNQIVNAILGDASYSDAILYCMNKANVKSLLMSPAQKNSVHSQIILTPIPLLEQLNRLCNEYHIHNAGTLIFFDIDCVYILDKRIGCTAYRNNEYKTTYLTSFPYTKDGSQVLTGFYANSKERYSAINVTGNMIDIRGVSTTMDKISGRNAIVINSNSGKVTRSSANLKMPSSALNRVNKVVVADTGDDPSSAMAQSMEKTQRIISLLCSDININALTPNKEFCFTTDNPKYTNLCGKYRIVYLNASFAKDGPMYKIASTCQFVGG